MLKIQQFCLRTYRCIHLLSTQLDYKLDRFINLQNNKKMRSTRRKKICDDKEKINKMYILNFILMLALYIYVIF
jgi:hypothetical protein